MVGLPYFNFFCSEWIQGEITDLELAPQGLFINICAHYWFKDCKLSLNFIRKNIPFFTEQCFTELIKTKLIKVKDDQISITFLNLQFEKRMKKQPINKANGKRGGRPRKPKINPNETHTITQSESEKKGNRIDIPLRGDRYVEGNIEMENANHSNGIANSDSPTGLWARLSSKANLSAEEKAKGEKVCLEWFEKICASPEKKNMIEKLQADFKMHPHLFENSEEIISMLEIVYGDFNPNPTEQP